ncbi:MAG: TonB-dependent receptor, partial [Cyclobacteriaceae bacterium]
SEVIIVDAVLANKATNNARQIYSKVPGLNIWESDGAGVQLGIGGRGLSPNRSSNFNVRQNGYDISADALGYPESYYTPPVLAVKRIEIIRGAASLQYGTQFGGLVNFRLKDGSDTEKLDVKSLQTAGSFGLFNSFNSVGGSIGKVKYYTYYNYKKSGGWRPNSSLDQHSAYTSIIWNPGVYTSIRAEYTLTDYLAQQPGGLTDIEFENTPRISKRDRNWFKVNWNLFALTFDHRFSSKLRLNNRTFGLVASRLALGNLQRIDRPDDPSQVRNLLSDKFRNWGNETRLIYNYDLGKQSSVFLIGARYYHGLTLREQGDGSAAQGPDFDFLNPDDLEGSAFDLPSRNTAFFIENIFKLSDKLSITPGIRFEHIRTEADGFYRETRTDLAGNIIFDQRIDENKSSSRSFVFGGIGLSYKASAEKEIYANFSQNYRAINFNDIRVVNPSLTVDENLQDERGFNIDLGFRGQQGKKITYDVSAFFLSYRDRIGTILKREPDPRFNNLVDRVFRFRSNIADASIYGVELFAEANLKEYFNWQSVDKFNLFTNVAVIRSMYRNTNEPGISGNEVELVPPVNLKSGLSVKKKNFEAALQMTYVTRHFSDASNAERTSSAVEGIIPTYYVVDLSAKYHYRNYMIQAGLNNITNNIYFTRRAAGYPGPGIIPSDGRSFYVTLGVDL